jgi:hypothetical protein
MIMEVELLFRPILSELFLLSLVLEVFHSFSFVF